MSREHPSGSLETCWRLTDISLKLCYITRNCVAQRERRSCTDILVVETNAVTQKIAHQPTFQLMISHRMRRALYQERVRWLSNHLDWNLPACKKLDVFLRYSSVSDHLFNDI